MKNIIFLLPLVFAISSCNNESCSDGLMNQNEADIDCGGQCSLCPIEYSISGVYGQNLLAGVDSLNLGLGDYSFRAKLLEGSSLRIELHLITGTEWFYSLGSTGWTVGPYNNGFQVFDLPNPGTFDLNFHLAPSANPGPVGGTFYIKYFENDATSGSSKHVTWG